MKSQIFKLTRGYVLPYAYDKRAHDCVAKAVADAAVKTRVNKI